MHLREASTAIILLFTPIILLSINPIANITFENVKTYNTTIKPSKKIDITLFVVNINPKYHIDAIGTCGFALT